MGTTLTTVTRIATAEFLEWCARQLGAGRLKGLSIEMPENTSKARASIVMEPWCECDLPPGCVSSDRDDEDEIDTEPGIKQRITIDDE